MAYRYERNWVTIVWMTNKNAVSWVEIAPDDGSHFTERNGPYTTDVTDANRLFEPS
jgi:hypothetical protein